MSVVFYFGRFVICISKFLILSHTDYYDHDSWSNRSVPIAKTGHRLFDKRKTNESEVFSERFRRVRDFGFEGDTLRYNNVAQ